MVIFMAVPSTFALSLNPGLTVFRAEAAPAFIGGDNNGASIGQQVAPAFAFRTELRDAKSRAQRATQERFQENDHMNAIRVQRHCRVNTMAIFFFRAGRGSGEAGAAETARRAAQWRRIHRHQTRAKRANSELLSLCDVCEEFAAKSNK
jgi:hypothetical protein